jgi:hypothetical protein
MESYAHSTQLFVVIPNPYNFQQPISFESFLGFWSYYLLEGTLSDEYVDS